jgi:hypothetical protein
MVAGTYQAFVDRLHANLPGFVLRQTVHESVKHLLKKELTADLLFKVAWRLAGNIEKLLEQQTVSEWNGQKEFEWIPVQVCDIQTVRRYSKLVNLFTFQSLGGSVVPLKLTQTWSFKKTNYLAVYRNMSGYGFGFSRSRINGRGEQQNAGLYRNPSQFYGLRCFLLLDPIRSQSDPVAVEVGHTSATTHYNKRLIEGRDRSRTPCIKGLAANLECYMCPYGIDRCALATHEATYKRGTCPKCEQVGFFDPLEIEHPKLCLTCVQEERKI